MSKYALFFVSAALAGFCLWYFQPRIAIRWLAGLDTDVTYFIDTDERVVALTIDDGPHPQVTPRILDTLREHDARATFFLIGERIPGNEALLERMRAEGHEIANHLMTDRPSIFLDAKEFEERLLRVEELAGIDTTQTRWFRPGSGWYSRPMKRVLARHGYRLALASAFPRDTAIRSVEAITWYLLRRVRPGDIILLHDGKRDRIRTAGVLRRVLGALKARGYDVVTLTELARRAENRKQSTPRP